MCHSKTVAALDAEEEFEEEEEEAYLNEINSNGQACWTAKIRVCSQARLRKLEPCWIRHPPHLSSLNALLNAFHLPRSHETLQIAGIGGLTHQSQTRSIASFNITSVWSKRIQHNLFSLTSSIVVVHCSIHMSILCYNLR